MMIRPLQLALALVLVLVSMMAAPAAHADPAKCQKIITKQMQKQAKKHVQLLNKCLDKENVWKIPGPCPDASTAFKLSKTATAVGAKIAASCSMSDLTTLGFAGDCELEPAAGGVEAGCFALPVTTPGEFASCLQCWQDAEVSEMVATLYASHANEVCAGDLTDTSTICSSLDVTSPLPDQRSLGPGGESDCQQAIGKGGFKYFVLREKTLASCATKGGTKDDCLLDPVVQLKLAKAALKMDTIIDKKCGNRVPQANPPFCCKAGGGNMCVGATTRDECENVHFGQVQEGKFCDVDDTCSNPPGNVKGITWWENCPEDGAALTDLDDLKGCVETASGTIIDELLCWTFPGGGGTDWPCPPEGSPGGAFVDGWRFF